MLFAVLISKSKVGIMIVCPALLTKQSGVPLVLALTISIAACTLGKEVGSIAIVVTLERYSRCDIFSRLRALAKTCRPRFWKASTSAEPIPPVLQPVIRTDLRAMRVTRMTTNLEEVQDVEDWSRASRRGRREGENETKDY